MKPASTTPTAFLLIDIQEGFKHPTHWGRTRSTPDFESSIVSLLSSARAYNASLPTSPSTTTSTTNHPHPILIIHITHHSLSPTSALHPAHRLPASITPHPSIAVQPIATPLANEPVLAKHHNSAFVGTPLEHMLRAHHIRQLVVVGLTTDHCVSTSVRFAANLQVLGDEGGPDGSGEGSHGVIVVRDGTATHERQGWDAETVHAVALASLEGEFAAVVEAEEVRRFVFGEGSFGIGADGAGDEAGN